MSNGGRECLHFLGISYLVEGLNTILTRKGVGSTREKQLLRLDLEDEKIDVQ